MYLSDRTYHKRYNRVSLCEKKGGCSITKSIDPCHTTLRQFPACRRTSWMVDRCFTPLAILFQSYHGDSSHY